MRFINIFILALFPIIFAVNVFAENLSATEDSIILTPEEQQFIKQHPEIVLGSGITFEPFTVQNSSGQVDGYDAEILNLISQRTGLKIRLELGNWEGIQKKAEHRELDGLSTSLPVEKRKKHYDFSNPYFYATSLIIVKKSNPSKIYSIDDLTGKRIAIQKGVLLQEDLGPEVLSKLEILYVDSQDELIQKIAKGEVDFAVIDDTAHYLAMKLGLGSFIEGAFPIGEPFPLVFCLRNDFPQLVSIINKGLSSITEAEKIDIRERWFNTKYRSSGVLTPIERELLARKGMLKVCGYADWMPYQKIERSGDMEGIASDYLTLFEKRLGISLRMQPSLENNPVRAMQGGDCDFVLLTDLSAVSQHDISLTTPYISFSYVVATTHDKQIVEDIGWLSEGSIGVVRGSHITAVLRSKYPQLKLIEVADVLTGLDNVRTQKLYGFIDSSAVVSYYVQTYKIPEIKIAGSLPIYQEFCVATRSDAPLLSMIFQKVVGSLSAQEKNVILNNWLGVKYEKGVDYRLIWRTVLISVFVLVVIIYWNRKLLREKKHVEEALTAERKAIQQNLDFTEMVSHEYRTPLSVLSSSLDLIEKKMVSGLYPELEKPVAKMRKSSERLKNLFSFALNEKRISDASISLVLKPINLHTLISTAIDIIGHIHSDSTVQNLLVEKDDVYVQADEELLLTVLTNILDNACKYSEPDLPVAVHGVKDGKTVCITVVDRGIGIDKIDREHVFDKFYRSATVGKNPGRGVGLFLVKKIIELHHGQISLSSQIGVGTKVTLTLPLPSEVKQNGR